MQQAGTGKKMVMARYGELFLKSEPVKHHFIGLLKRNIGKALTAAGLAHHFETPRGRILISCEDPEAVADIASRTFGVIDVSICTLTTTEADDLCSAALAFAEKKLNAGCTFAVRAKRQHKTGPDSQQLGALVGSAIYDHIPGLTVDLDHPGYELFV